MTPLLTILRAAVLVPLLACGAGAPATRAPTPAPAPSPAGVPAASAGQLARFAGAKVMVLPAQSLAAADPLGWRGASAGATAMLAALDSTLADSLAGRGLGGVWIFPPALERSASRNPTYVTSPSAMRALDAVRLAIRKRDEPLIEPFAGQLRALAGVSDARYALVPLELRFEGAPGESAGRAALRLAVLDARGAQVVWLGDVAGDPSPRFAPAVLASLAQRVADLVVIR